MDLKKISTTEKIITIIKNQNKKIAELDARTADLQRQIAATLDIIEKMSHRIR